VLWLSASRFVSIMKLLCLLALVMGSDALCARAAERPNVIVIIADDLGFGDISCNGSSTVQTPHIDRLATGGRRFTSGYCTASTCTPTRFSLLTGTYAFRVAGTGIAAPNSGALIQPGTETVASLLKQQGYATAAIGKWHLGLGAESPQWNGELKPGPLEIGFDHCLLLPTTNDRVPQVYIEDHRVRGLDPADPLWVGDAAPSADHPTGVSHRSSLWMDWSHGHNGTIHNGISRIGFYTGGVKARFRDQDLADEWVRDSVKFMEASKEQPFFLYFAAHDIHVPRAPHERFVGKSGMGPRGDCIVEFDWCVGALMQAVDRLGLAERTLVVLCSDNGPVLGDGYQDEAEAKLGMHRPAGPYSGGKYSVLEGGTRTPFITHWQGRIKPGVSDEIVSTIDLPASLAALTGAKLPADACLDSVNVLSALLGDGDGKGRGNILQQDNMGNKMGLREGAWKLIHTKAGPKAKKQASVEQLYDLAKDPGEANNVAKEQPEVLSRMRALLAKIIADGRTRVPD
jgi:arylsulfatase A-like enzyme